MSQAKALTPEEIVFRTNSDSKSIVIITSDRIVYAVQGMYGGFIIRSSDFGADAQSLQAIIQSARAFFVEPKIDETSLDNLPDEYKKKIMNYLNALPEDVKNEFSSKCELITYNYVEVTPVVKKVTDRYVVLDFEPKPNGIKVTAKAARLMVYWSGSRKHPRGSRAKYVLKEWKLKYPENQVIQKYMYAVTGLRDGRDSVIYLKIVLEAPRELLPPAPSVAPATESKVEEKPRILINGFLVISRLPSKALLDTHLPEIFRDVKIGTKQIKLAMGYFYNKLGTLSRKFYCQILPRFAVDAGFGYIVPKSKVSEFLSEVEMLKKEYEVFEKQLKEFLLHGRVPPEVEANKRAKVYKEYLDIVMEYLRQHGKDRDVREKIENLSIVDRVQIRLLPFAVDYRIVEEFVDEKVKEKIARELESFRRDMAEAVKEQIRRKAREIIERVKKYAETEIRKELLESLKKDVEAMEKEVEELGLSVPEELRMLKEMLVEEKLKELAVEAADGRLKALLEF
mgnify:CR=1 FL=1